MSTPDPPWYRDGLAFECTRCGRCCTGAPGYVWVSPDEIGRMAGHLAQPIAEFTRRHVRRVGARYSLIEKPNHDCIFWDRDAGCTVYEDRPDQCRTWPFWRENLDTPADWERVGRGCPGVGRGAVFPVEAIEAAARRGGT